MSKRVVLITGCSQPDSLGVALALALQRRGTYEVYASAKNIDSAGLQAARSEGCKALVLDVTSQSSVVQAVGSLASDTGGRLDVLVNNAATWARHTTLDIDLDAVKAMFDTNVFGPLRVIQACAPLLLSSETDKRPMVVNIGSTAGNGPSPWQASYASTKAALNILSDTFRIETRGLGLEVLTVLPGCFCSHGFDNVVVAPLPPSRFYPTIAVINHTILEAFKKIVKFSPTVDAVSADIVARIDRGKGGWLYTGAQAFAARFIVGYLPHNTISNLIGNMFGSKLVKPPSADQLRAGTVWNP